MRAAVASRPRRARRADALATAFGAASLLLRYPDAALVADLPALRASLCALPEALARPLEECAAHLARTDPLAAQVAYVETFDLRRRACLYLTYYLNGDTRRRGAQLWRFADAFAQAGLRVGEGELPDYLPAVLELAATAPASVALELLAEHRAGLSVLAESLAESGSPYAGVVAAVESLLPARSATDRATAARLAEEGPPAEMVGLEPTGPLAPYGAGATPVEIGRRP